MSKIRMRSRRNQRPQTISVNTNNSYGQTSLVANQNDPNFAENYRHHKKQQNKAVKLNDIMNKKKFDTFKRTGFPFGTLLYEIKHRYSEYFDDIKDGLNLHCFIAFICIFTVCIAPGLCFGGILADKTDRWFGINEMLIATCMNGVIFGLFSGQPLMILGATGPFLVFEEMIYNVRLVISRFGNMFRKLKIILIFKSFPKVFASSFWQSDAG